MLQVELITQNYEGSPGMTEMLRFIEQYGFAPVAVSPSPLDHMGPGEPSGHLATQISVSATNISKTILAFKGTLLRTELYLETNGALYFKPILFVWAQWIAPSTLYLSRSTAIASSFPSVGSFSVARSSVHKEPHAGSQGASRRDPTYCAALY
jgi:hypothetical protein